MKRILVSIVFLGAAVSCLAAAPAKPVPTNALEVQVVAARFQNMPTSFGIPETFWRGPIRMAVAGTDLATGVAPAIPVTVAIKFLDDPLSDIPADALAAFGLNSPYFCHPPVPMTGSFITDGLYELSLTLPDNGSVPPERCFMVPGDYRFSVIVTDANGKTGRAVGILNIPEPYSSVPAW